MSSLQACDDASPQVGCDGSKVEVEGVYPPPAYWRNPLLGERGDGKWVTAEDVERLAFVPTAPRKLGTPLKVLVSEPVILRRNRRVVWTYRTQDGLPFFVAQRAVKYTQARLEARAAKCHIDDHQQDHPGYAMVELDDGTQALFIGQSIVMSTTYLRSGVTRDGKPVTIEVDVEAPGRRNQPDDILEIANNI